YYCNCEQKILNETEQISEENCQLKCPSNKKQTCGGYFGPKSFYEIKKTILSLSALPSHIGKINETIAFKIEINEIISFVNFLRIDFGDGTKINFSLMDIFLIEKKYSKKGLYKIEVASINYELNAEIDILIKDNTKKLFVNSREVFIFDNGEIVGCIENISSLTTQIHGYLPRNSEVCSSQCLKKGFSFTALRNSYCNCINTSLSTIQIDSCLCACPYTNDRICGCLYNSIIFKIQNNEKSTMAVGTFRGCFKTDFNNQSMGIFGFLTNEVCIQYCDWIKKDFASLIGTNCYCGNHLNESNQVDTDECFYKCNGNQSQSCGGFDRFSVYKITKLEFYLFCLKIGEKFKKINCSIYLNSTSPSSLSSNTSGSILEKNASVLIDFGDLDHKYLSIKSNTEIFIEKAYNETGTFKIKAVLLNTPLNNSATIKIERYSMEIDFKNEYQGCFFDRFPYEMHDFVYVNKLIMNNKFCQEFCGFYGFNFSSTFNGDTCSCGNNFGSYNGPKYKIKCDKRCVGVQSDICGGRVFRPYSVFISERSNLNLKILTPIIGYNRRKIFQLCTVISLYILLYRGSLLLVVKSSDLEKFFGLP
ncbi:unnamed protein product, partial [Brachionus calyciflorus]